MLAKQNHYEVLEIGKDAKLIDIKKAYRRLALKHHPDRNGGSAESTEKFKEISHAYTVLSENASRRQFDASLNCGPTSTSTASSPSKPGDVSVSTASADSQSTPPQARRDPFKQFDDLFRNDPFFHDAFRDMDDAFSQRFDAFEAAQNLEDVDTSPGDGGAGGVEPLFFCGIERPGSNKKSVKKVPWTEWLMNKLGIELSVTSYSHSSDGTVKASSYTSKPFGTYTNKKSHTFVENGQKVSVISMEKNGNRIEDKFIAGKLVERKVNGKKERITQQVAAS